MRPHLTVEQRQLALRLKAKGNDSSRRKGTERDQRAHPALRHRARRSDRHQPGSARSRSGTPSATAGAWPLLMPVPAVAARTSGRGRPV